MHVYMVWIMRYNLIKIQLEKKSDIKENWRKATEEQATGIICQGSAKLPYY